MGCSSLTWRDKVTFSFYYCISLILSGIRFQLHMQRKCHCHSTRKICNHPEWRLCYLSTLQYVNHFDTDTLFCLLFLALWDSAGRRLCCFRPIYFMIVRGLSLLLSFKWLLPSWTDASRLFGSDYYLMIGRQQNFSDAISKEIEIIHVFCRAIKWPSHLRVRFYDSATRERHLNAVSLQTTSVLSQMPQESWAT